MMRWRKCLLIVVIMSMMTGFLLPEAFAQGNWKPNDPTTDEWMMLDVLVARPLGIVAGVLGTGVFILSLPYTLPTRGVDQAAEIFIKRPFKFSFTRPCPDEDM